MLDVQAHNILLLCLEMMDVYGDQGNLNKELRRHAKNFSRPFRMLVRMPNDYCSVQLCSWVT